jgi:uncharacterized protein
VNNEFSSLIASLGAAHLPGRGGAAAPRDAFESVTSAIPPRIDQANIVACPAWRLGLELYAAGYYWETHEVLEPLWMAAKPNSRERHLVQGLIQLANACLKLKMGQPNAAGRLVKITREHVLAAADGRADEFLGVDLQRLLSQLDALAEAVEMNRAEDALAHIPSLT